MIDYYNDEYTMVMSCDGYDCDKDLELSGEFVECIQEAKDEGWRIFKDDYDDTWNHLCSRCWANKGAIGVFE